MNEQWIDDVRDEPIDIESRPGFEHELRQVLEHEWEGTTARTLTPESRRQRSWMLGAVAACVLVLIAGLVAMTRDDDAPAPGIVPSDERPTPPSTPAAETSTTSPSAPSVVPAPSVTSPTSSPTSPAPTSHAPTEPSHSVATSIVIATPPAATGPCSTLTDSTEPDEEIVDVVACRRWSDGQQAIVRRYDPDAGPTSAIYRVAGDWASFMQTEAVDLIGPLPIDGLDAVSAFRWRSADGHVECVVLVSDQVDGWREFCRTTGEETPTLIFGVDDDLVQIEHYDDDRLRGSVLLEMPAVSGCTLADAKSIYLAIVGPNFGSEPSPAVALTSIRCTGDRATASVGSVLLQPGPPDGSLYLLERTNGDWTVTDAGTGIDLDDDNTDGT